MIITVNVYTEIGGSSMITRMTHLVEAYEHQQKMKLERFMNKIHENDES